jgi:hypothetical protein
MEVMDSQITLGEKRNKIRNPIGSDLQTTSMNAGAYTIDVIRNSNNYQSIMESAKFNSNHESPKLPPEHKNHEENNSMNKRSIDSKKLVSISLAPDLLDAFASRKAKYVIKKNRPSPSFESLANKRKTTYYERCKMRKMQLYGTKSIANLRNPTPPLEFEGPFLNVQIRVQSAPKSVRSMAMSALKIS